MLNPKDKKNKNGKANGGAMLRTLGAAQKREVKATQNLSRIVLFFMICWVPLYTLNSVRAFCRNCTVYEPLEMFCIILSHANSAGNPLLYAYHLKDFRAALKNFILAFVSNTPSTGNYQYRPSLASNTAFNNYYSQYKSSIRDTRNDITLLPYTTPRNYTNNKFAKPYSLPHSKTISSIVATTISMATSPLDGKTEEDIWKISETGLCKYLKHF